MRSQNKLQELATPRNIVIAVVLIFVVLPIIIFAITRRGPGLDSLPEDSSESDYTKVANIHDGLPLMRQLEGANRYNAFARDLFVYAKNNIEGYKNVQKVVGFQLISDIKKSDNKITFDGEYGSSRDDYAIEIELLGNDRMKVSLVNKSSKTNDDQNLPSNSKLNQYIASLPQFGKNYDVEYIKSSDKMSIRIYSNEPATVDQAVAEILEKTGETELSPDWSEMSLPLPTPESTTSNPRTMTDENGNNIFIEGS